MNTHLIITFPESIDRYLRIDGECLEARTRPKVGSGVRLKDARCRCYYLLSTLNSLSNKK